MRAAPTIEYQGFEPDDHVRSLLSYRIDRLEDRCGSIRAVRVVVESTDRRGVRLEVELPGTQLAVSRHPAPDVREEEVDIVIRDAFDAAESWLERWSEEHPASSQPYRPRLHGTVTRVAPAEGCLTTDDGLELWFPRAAVADGAFDLLEAGARVSYVESDLGRASQITSSVHLLRRSVLGTR